MVCVLFYVRNNSYKFDIYSIISAIKHPNAVNVFAACTEQDNLCLVMEYMKEGSLKSYLHKKNAGKPTSWPMLYRIALDIAFVLQHLHSINRVYRDLNSENVLVSFIING